MCNQTIQPSQIVVELRARLRIPVWRIDRRDQHAIDRCFNVSALRIARITGKRALRDDRLCAARQYRDTVPTSLPAPRRAVSRRLDRRGGKARILGFQLLQAHDVGPRRVEPVQQIREPLVDVIDVESRDLHDGFDALSWQRRLPAADNPRWTPRSSNSKMYPF